MNAVATKHELVHQLFWINDKNLNGDIISFAADTPKFY